MQNSHTEEDYFHSSLLENPLAVQESPVGVLEKVKLDLYYKLHICYLLFIILRTVYNNMYCKYYRVDILSLTASSVFEKV